MQQRSFAKNSWREARDECQRAIQDVALFHVITCGSGTCYAFSRVLYSSEFLQLYTTDVLHKLITSMPSEYKTQSANIGQRGNHAELPALFPVSANRSSDSNKRRRRSFEWKWDASLAEVKFPLVEDQQPQNTQGLTRSLKPTSKEKPQECGKPTPAPPCIRNAKNLHEGLALARSR